MQFNIDRAKNLPESKRKAELAPVASVDALDEFTVRFNLAQPFSPLLAQLSDRAGMKRHSPFGEMSTSLSQIDAKMKRSPSVPLCAGSSRFGPLPAASERGVTGASP